MSKVDQYIKGNYRRSIYQNGNGYHVGLFKIKDVSDESLEKYVDRTITFTGYFHELNEIDTYQFYGKIVFHEKYGEQFQVDSYERCMPEEKDSIIEFLTSGLFKGIGEKKANAIVGALGKDTLKIILENPSNLILIPSITEANIKTLHSKLKEYEASYETIIKLGDLGFSTKNAMLVYNFYKEKTLEQVEEDIYQLILDIYEISFKQIDRIAIGMGVLKDALIRVRGAILYIMDEVSNLYGHSYFFQDEIRGYLNRIFGFLISDDLFSEALSSLEDDIYIIKRGERYYLKEMYESEVLIVKRFRLLDHNPEIEIKKIEEKLVELENHFQIKYNREQKEAIKQSVLKHFLIITGGPGTGKTTILKGITEMYRISHKLTYAELQEKIALLAPTGRAAKRMSEATSLSASTIHRFLKWQKETNKFQVNEYNKSKAELIILDEASMVDTYLMAHLLKGISVNCKVIMVGDSFQLPSVGPGQVLHDLIASDMLPCIFLKELYRQGKDSHILTLAYDVRKGDAVRDVFNVGEDLTFIDCPSGQVIKEMKEIARTYQDLYFKDLQILAPMYKTINGIDEINKNLQEIFNPKESRKKEIMIGDVLFREQDKVIELTNMPDENVYNGDIGIVKKIVTSPKKEVYIEFDSGEVKYTPASFNKFRLAYAISIHKSQGSEFDVVIIPVVKGFRKMLYRRLIYTGITRSKKKLYLIGDFEALQMAVANTSSDIRRTTIKEFLISGIN